MIRLLLLGLSFGLFECRREIIFLTVFAASLRGAVFMVERGAPWCAAACLLFALMAVWQLGLARHSNTPKK